IDLEVVAFDPFDAAGLGITNLATAIATIAANLNATIASRAQPSDISRPGAISSAVDTELTLAHGAGSWAGGGGGGGSIDPSDIFNAIVEGPNQIDGGGETTKSGTSTPADDVTFVQMLREIWAGAIGDGTGMGQPVGQTMLKSRAGGRNRN